jgi:hypothetical protein
MSEKEVSVLQKWSEKSHQDLEQNSQKTEHMEKVKTLKAQNPKPSICIIRVKGERTEKTNGRKMKDIKYKNILVLTFLD